MGSLLFMHAAAGESVRNAAVLTVWPNDRRGAAERIQENHCIGGTRMA
jgi:hypothetical protein